MSTWVLVANAGEARLYSTEKIGTALERVREFEHPEARMRGTKLASDVPAQAKGAGHGPLGVSSDPKTEEIEKFAAQLAKVLDEGRAANAYRHLVLVAAPHFHGLINKHLDSHTQALVSHDIEKDYTTLSERDLAARLKEVVKG